MDVLAVTDFPDVRFKSLIQSANDGSIIIIPREGGYLFRLYIELDKLDAGERVSDRNITADDLIAAAQRILKPYTLDVKEVPWWSVYEIGQRLCDKFDDVPEEDDREAFAARVHRRRRLPHPQPEGRAGHERLHAGRFQSRMEAGRRCLRKRCAPHLLHTYSAERQADRQGADRLRPRMGRAAGIEQTRASTRPRPKAISSGTGATRRGPRRITVPRSSPAKPPISIWPRG